VIVCLECGYRNDEGREFCESCGTFLEWKGEQQRERTGEIPVQRDDTDELAPVSDGRRPQLPAVCPRCGEPGKPGLNYCSRCGRPLVIPTDEPQPRRRAVAAGGRSSRGLWLAGVALLVVGAGVALWMFLRRPEPATPAAVVQQPVASQQPSAPPQQQPSAPPPPAAAALEVVAVNASTVLDQDGDIIYDPQVTVDGDPSTAWNDGVRGDPTGESLEYRFASPVRVTQIDLINGYDKIVPEGDRFEQNARIREVTLQSDAGETTTELEDTREPQSVAAELGPTCQVTLVVDSIYPGAEFEDVALSEITFLGTVDSEDPCPGG
jgi:Double zinc ribbon